MTFELNETFVVAGCFVLSGAVSWGVLKGSMQRYITKTDHRDQCTHNHEIESKKRTEIYNKMGEKFDRVDDKLDKIFQAVGRVEGIVNGGDKSKR